MNKTIGIISANYRSNDFGTLMENRSFASLPFGGRYRMVDFPLSNMVNSGIGTVGLISPYMYRSLIDHVGIGKPWGLSKKVGGMFILPGAPYGIQAETKFLLKDLIQNKPFITRDRSENILFCGTNTIYNMDFRPLIEEHEKTGATVTLVYTKVDGRHKKKGLYFDISDSGRVESIHFATAGCNNYFIDCFIVRSKYVERFMEWYASMPHFDLMEIIARNLNAIDVRAYRFDGYVGVINTTKDYMKVNLDLLDPEVENQLFRGPRGILTKPQDTAPAYYSNSSKVKNSVVANGCIIDGEVENCIIFRSSVIKKGVKVKNSILMQHCILNEDAVITNAICDKYVTVQKAVRIEGGDAPFIIGKNTEL